MTVHRSERILAFMMIAVVGVSLLSFFAILIAGATGYTNFKAGVWPTVFSIPYLGFPIGLLLILVLLFTSLRRRSREARMEAEAAASAPVRPPVKSNPATRTKKQRRR